MIGLDLIDRVKTASCDEGVVVDRYWLRFWDAGWAVVYLDRWGIMTVTSEMGCWAHAWGGGPENWGAPTFEAFVRGADAEYLALKLSHGRKDSVPDPEATAKAMKEHVNGLHITPDEADTLGEQIDKFCDGLEYNEDVAYLSIRGECDELNEEFDCIHEWIEYKPAPKFAWLRDQLLPVFLAYLRDELQVQKEDPNGTQGEKMELPK